jgi:hypothetical protein
VEMEVSSAFHRRRNGTVHDARPLIRNQVVLFFHSKETSNE